MDVPFELLNRSTEVNELWIVILDDPIGRFTTFILGLNGYASWTSCYSYGGKTCYHSIMCYPYFRD